MKRANEVETILEATKGKLLSEDDFSLISRIKISNPPSIVYSLESSGYWNIKRPNELMTYENIFIKARVTPETSVLIPTIKLLYIRELAINWALPSLYFWQGCDNIYWHAKGFPFAVSWQIKAAELYKALINDILNLFIEEDRETVKCRMLAQTVGVCVQQMSLALGYGIREDIADKKEKFGITKIPQIIIDQWIEYSSIVDAWIAEANVYKRAAQLYNHKHHLKNIKEWTKKGYNIPYVYHPDDKRSYRQWRLTTKSHYVKEFMQERAAALNPPLAPYESLAVKVHPTTMRFIHGTQKASQLISCLHNPDPKPSAGEHAMLLDKLDGYKPKYVPPKSANANSIDADIELLEKQIMLYAEQASQQSVEELLQVIKDAINLLSLVHMRYQVSLSSKDETSYFAWFKSASTTDKEYYYEIFACYVDNIFQKCLPTLLKLTIAEPVLHKTALSEAIEAIDDLVELSRDICSYDSPKLNKAVNFLSSIQTTYQNTNSASDGLENGLRQRIKFVKA